jgi:hypothetical protein
MDASTTCALTHIRSSINTEDAKMIACSVVASRLEYANSMLYDVSQKNITRLQRVQNALTRCVVNSTKSKVHHTSSVALLRQLHWLPVEFCIQFKVAKLAFLLAHLLLLLISTH